MITWEDDAPPIYFVTLDLPAPKRTLLENRGIAPIDLSPIAPAGGDWLDTDDRYEEAYRWLIKLFEDARPPDPLKWPRLAGGQADTFSYVNSPDADLPPSPHQRSQESERRPPSKRAGLQNTSDEEGDSSTSHVISASEAWAEERERYPGWVVPPKQVRDRLWRRTREWNQEALGKLDSIGSPHDLEILYELLWRLDKAFLFISEGQELNQFFSTLLRYNPFPNRLDLEKVRGLIDFSEDEIPGKEREEENGGKGRSSDVDPPITPITHPDLSWPDLRIAWATSALAVLQSFRENGQDQLFQAWQESLSPVVTDQAKWAAQHALERATHRLDNLDYPAARQVLTTWIETEEKYPYGGVRRASLLAEAGDTEQAVRVASNALDQILEAQAEISRPSLRLQSEERWVRNLLTQFQKARKFRRDRDELEIQPETLQEPKGLGGNPIDRLEKVREVLKGPPPNLGSGKDVTPNFDLGSYKTKREARRVEEFQPAFAYIRMKEEGGLPLRIDQIAFAREDTTNASNWIRPIKPAWSWSLLSRLASEKSFRDVLTRKRVSGLSGEHARELFERAYRGVKTSAEDLGSGGDETDVARGRLKGLIDFLSRLSVRRDLDGERALVLAVRLSKNPELQSAGSSDTYGKVGDLLERSALSMPDGLVRKHIDDLFSLPLVGRDLPSSGTIGRWFEPTDRLPQIDLQPGDVRSERISRLVAVLENRSSTPPDTDPEEERPVARLFASTRLRYLYRCGALSEEQIDAFASAYWQQSDNTNGLPDLFGVTVDFSLGVPSPPSGASRSERVRRAVLDVEDLAVGSGGFGVPTNASKFTQTLRRGSTPVNGQIPNGAERIQWDAGEAEKLLTLLADIWDADSDRYVEEREKEIEHGAHLISVSDVIRRHLRVIPLALRDAVLPTVDQNKASEIHRIVSEMNDLEFATAVVYPDLLRLDAVSAEEARRQIQQHLAAEDNWDIEMGARAVEWWVRLWDKEELGEKPERLIRDLVNHIIMRRRPGLTVVLKTVASIVEEVPSAIDVEHAKNLSSTLTPLDEETAPPSEREAWRMPEIKEGQVRSRGDRAAVAALASSLRNWYGSKEGLEEPDEIESWREVAQKSPMPEVYEAWDED